MPLFMMLMLATLGGFSATAASEAPRPMPVEIARGTSWVSPYWGYNAPKIVFDGEAYYTAGLWGELKTAEGVLYRCDGKTSVAGARLPGLYQPAVLALDAQKRLIAVHTRLNAPVRLLRAKVPGQHKDFEDLPPPPGMQAAYYIGIAVYREQLYLASLDATNSMWLNRLDLNSLAWSAPCLVQEGQIAQKPKTAWTYPILVPEDHGLHLFASNAPDGGEGNTYNEVWHMFFPNAPEAKAERERIADSTMGNSTFVLDAALDAQGALHVLFSWNVHVYGDPVSEGRPVAGLYHAWRKSGVNAWQFQRMANSCYGGFFVSDGTLHALLIEGGPLIRYCWNPGSAGWERQAVVLDTKELPVFPGFVDTLHPASGAVAAPGLALVSDGLLPAEKDQPQVRVLWGLFPSAKP